MKNLPWSPAITKFITSDEETAIYLKANLKESIVGGRPALIRTDIE